ncbi:hypothetical protein PV326_005172 [Microctonus aethiopoides]|nr:hypothetical protein PV326_005172 [Microctonus aethiopoides]
MAHSLFVWFIVVIFFTSIISWEYGSAVVLPEIQKDSSQSTLEHQVILDDHHADEDVFIPYQGERFSIFDWNLCRLMARKYHENILISPISLKLALVLLYEGAQDQTAHELAGVLHLPIGQLETRNKFSGILRSLQEVSNQYRLNLGTKMFLDRNISLKQSYSAVIKTFYNTDVEPSNFADVHSTAERINSWVKNITYGNIQTIIDDENDMKDSIMMVLNAIYFKGFWFKNKFLPNNTKIDKFYENINKSFDVKFMKAFGNFDYVESPELDAKILRIPYQGRKFAMYFILPRTIDGLDYVIKNVNSFILSRYVGMMQRLPVEVTIPRFKFEFTTHFESILREMGIRDIFDNTAILTGIAKAKRAQSLIVTDIIQKAGIEVNEMGTAAYAATEVNVGNKVADQQFNANHPFVFYIEDETTGTILYVGRVNNPLMSIGSTLETSTKQFVPVSTVGNSPVQQVDDEINERFNYFNVEFMQIVNDLSEGNVVMSPLSIKTALTILSEGTGGRTREELLSTLRLPTDQQQTRDITKKLLQIIQNNGTSETEIYLANRLWIGQSVEVSNEFNNLLKFYYGGDTKSMAFGNATSSEVINDWVRQATKNHIHSIVDPGTLSGETKLLLTSALYFKAKWRTAFDENATRNRCFNIPERGCFIVPMMEDLSTFRYAKIASLKAEVVEIPYHDEKLSMLIVLPIYQGLQNLNIVSKDLAHKRISELLECLKDTELILQLPRFSIESKINLKPALESLGIRELFNFNANLSGILPNGGARVRNVVHSAKIEVNEQGTVASAATAFAIIPLMGATHDIVRVDRPFLFLIVDRPSSTIIFAGRVIQP